jgi:hypothetical protein
MTEGVSMVPVGPADYAFRLALWHTFGKHTGELAEDILVRKAVEIERNGWTLWSFRKMKMLDDWVRYLTSAQQPRVLVFCSDRGGQDPLARGGTAKGVDCRSYRLIGERSWRPLPEGVRVPHTFRSGERYASAFVVQRIIHPVKDLEGPSIEIEWLSRDGTWRSGCTPTTGGLPSRGEFLIRPGGMGTMRGVGTILELKSPYLAEVSTDLA